MIEDEHDVILLLIAACVGIIVTTMIATFFVVPQMDINKGVMVMKIMRGDLPDCATTIGSDTGYYCQVDRISYFCKVDKNAVDPYVRMHPFCNEVEIH